MTALLIGLGVALVSLAPRAHSIEPGQYLGDVPTPRRPRRRWEGHLPGGMIWGVGVGLLTGSMFPGRTMALLMLGAGGGALAGRAVASTQRERRARRLAQELPTVADTLALHFLAGESVVGSIRRLLAVCRGVAADEMAAAAVHPDGLESGLRVAASTSCHPDAARLYELLGHAHRTGGRLAESLGELAADYRTALTAALTAEGGRRALTSYGPILAFMIPVTLLFLMYPTLAGLSALSARP